MAPAAGAARIARSGGGVGPEDVEVGSFAVDRIAVASRGDVVAVRRIAEARADRERVDPGRRQLVKRRGEKIGVVVGVNREDRGEIPLVAFAGGELRVE